MAISLLKIKIIDVVIRNQYVTSLTWQTFSVKFVHKLDETTKLWFAQQDKSSLSSHRGNGSISEQNKLESPSPKDALGHNWLKLALWFWNYSTGFEEILNFQCFVGINSPLKKAWLVFCNLRLWGEKMTPHWSNPLNQDRKILEK